MKSFEIRTETDYQKLPDSFKELTEINIYCDLYKIKPIGNALQYVSGNATIKYVSGNATIQCVSDNATIQSVYNNATIQSVSGNATIKIFKASVKIITIKQQAIIIFQDCKKPKGLKHPFAIETTTQEHNIETFCDIYQDNMIDKKHIKLYKSVNETTLCDFRTGKIKYEGVVECPDFDLSNDRECSGGLHLSPLPELALSFNNGKILECKVAIKDIVVYGKDIKKVRCKKVEVIG